MSNTVNQPEGITKSIIKEVECDFLFNTKLKDTRKLKEFHKAYINEEGNLAATTLLEMIAKIFNKNEKEYVQVYGTNTRNYLISIHELIQTLILAYYPEDFHKTEGLTPYEILQASKTGQAQSNSVIDSAELNEKTLKYNKYYAILASDITENNNEDRIIDYKTNPMQYI